MKHLIRGVAAAAILLAASASAASASGNDFCGNGFSTCSTPTVFFDQGRGLLSLGSQFSGFSGNFDFQFDLNRFFGEHGFGNIDWSNVCVPGSVRAPRLGFWGNDCAPLSTTAPEPITMTLLATGLVGMGGVGLLRRRKRTR